MRLASGFPQRSSTPTLSPARANGFRDRRTTNDPHQGRAWRPEPHEHPSPVRAARYSIVARTLDDVITSVRPMMDMGMSGRTRCLALNAIQQ